MQSVQHERAQDRLRVQAASKMRIGTCMDRVSA
jgi:hypothetical protein